MTTKQRFSLVRLFAACARAVIIAWTLIFLSEYFGWHLLSEAGGTLVRAAL